MLLVGFMAAGKSSVAACLERRLGWPLRDVDRILEEETGLSVPEIFATRGETWFREREAAATRRLLDEAGVIVAPGGGWAAVEGRLDEVPGQVLSVWLRVGLEEALRRAAASPAVRPLLDDASDPQRMAEIRRLFERRERRYRRAALHLDTDGAAPIELAERIVNHMARGPAPDGRTP